VRAGSLDSASGAAAPRRCSGETATLAGILSRRDTGYGVSAASAGELPMGAEQYVHLVASSTHSRPQAPHWHRFASGPMGAQQYKQRVALSPQILLHLGHCFIGTRVGDQPQRSSRAPARRSGIWRCTRRYRPVFRSPFRADFLARNGVSQVESAELSMPSQEAATTATVTWRNREAQ